jgi:hypothetical protein
MGLIDLRLKTIWGSINEQFVQVKIYSKIGVSPLIHLQPVSGIGMVHVWVGEKVTLLTSS